MKEDDDEKFNGGRDDENEEFQFRDVPEASYGPHSKTLDFQNYAKRLIKVCGGKFISIGRELWKYNDSFWQEVTFDQYRPSAVRIQSGPKSVQTTNGIIEMMRFITQKDARDIRWQGPVRFEDETRKVVKINLKNCDLRVELTGVNRIQQCDPKWKDYVIGQLPVDYDPEAKCPTFEYLLETSLPDPKDRLVLQCFVGYCLMQDHRFQCVLFCHGRPNSGKSLLIYHGLGSLFGADLTSHVSLESICNGGDELRMLERSLVNIGTEIDSRQLKDSAIFNQIACGEVLDKALKYDKARKILVNCKFIFIGNHYPHWERGSDAQARRIKIIHFPGDFTDNAKDGELEMKVKAEGSGIFNWALRGLLEVAERDQIPFGGMASKSHAKQFKANNNPMGTFNHRFCRVAPGLETVTEDYRRAFRHWCSMEAIAVKQGDSQISQLLRREHPEIIIKPTRIKGKSTRAFVGIELNKRGLELLRGYDGIYDY